MIFLELLKPIGLDFTVYYEAAYMILRGMDPYRGIFSSTFPFNYPPPAFLFIFWLGFFPKYLAGPLWNMSSLAALLVSLWFLLAITGVKRKVLIFLLAALLFTLPFFPVKFNLGNGQINNFLLLFSVLSLYFYRRGRKNISVLILAYATGIKLAPVIFLLYFLIRGDGKQILRFLVFLVIIFLIPFIFIPWWKQSEYYFHILFLSFGLGAKDWYYNQSLEGFLARSFHRPAVIYGLTYIGSAVLVGLTYFRGRVSKPLLAMAAVACLYLLIHPIALQHYFGLTIIPLIILAVRFKRDKAVWWQWILLGLAYLLVAMNIKEFNSVSSEFGFLLSHDFYGVLLLWILALFGQNSYRIVFLLWSLGVLSSYLFGLLCRGGICF